MSIRILVVDDNDILREDLCQQLAKQPDFTVAGSASSGAEAVRLAMEVECDLILMDIEMESIRAGIDAATQIHSRRPKLQIIYLTAHDNDDMILTAMATGAVDYFVKGSDNDELYRHIRMAYEGNPIMSAHTQETPTERTLIRYLLQGLNARQISEIRVVGIETVKSQIHSIREKFGCTRTKEIVAFIRQLGLEHLFL